ncbi:MAG: hypothetical protein EBU90_16540 [Proteobacteria bacterium]|nr:hypothetical protein [Pseudomonadota bacterium]NBP15251.1 hypothetical protein [bacterium]
MLFFPPSFPPPPTKITVFVHGTHRFAQLVPKAIKPLYNRFHYEPGLRHISQAPECYCYRRFLASIAKYGNNYFPQEHCYLFGWSGTLSHEARVKAAEELHEGLMFLHKKYQRYELTLITHSHGGNVVLNLAGLDHKKPYQIDRLILIACPVQEVTKNFVFDPLFKEIYAPYSKWDSFQVLDPQGAVPRRRYVRCIFTQSARCTHLQFIPLFSERRFPADSKVKHISVIRWFRPLSHVEFLFPSFTKKLEQMLIKAKDHDFSKKEMRYKL